MTPTRTARTTICGGCYHRTSRHADGSGACTVTPLHPVTNRPTLCGCPAVEVNAFQELSDEERRALIMTRARSRA